MNTNQVNSINTKMYPSYGVCNHRDHKCIMISYYNCSKTTVTKYNKSGLVNFKYNKIMVTFHIKSLLISWLQFLGLLWICLVCHLCLLFQLPDGVNVSKEARRAISQAASVFVLYATSW